MERTIRIANTKTQQRYTIQTTAATLGELQDQMTAQGIDFAGMSFTEGISKTQLLGRDTQLPTNVMYKGQPTNDLVLLLTNTNKQIASGVIDRKEAYRLVKQLNLQNAIKEGEGDNYTRVSTATLEEYINTAQNGSEDVPAQEPVVEEKAQEKKLPDVKTAPHESLVEWIYSGIKFLALDNDLFPDDMVVLAELVTEQALRMKESELKITDSDVEDMIRSL